MGTTRLKSRRRQDQGLKGARVAIAILATVGLIDTGSITLKKWGWINSLSCLGGIDGCDKVLNSPWGTIFNNNNLSIPLSLIGFIGYFLILGLAVIPFFTGIAENKITFSRKSWWGLFLISCAMAVFSFLLIGIMILKIKAFCFFCILSALISTIILLLTLLGGRWENPGELLFRGFILSLVIILGGLIWSSSVDPTKKSINSNTPPIIKSNSTKQAIQLANHLTEKGAVMYNAYWCPHCHDQKEMFGKEAASKLSLVECAEDGLNSQSDLCKSKGITGFPSWEINGEIESGVKSLKELAELSNYNGSIDFSN